MITRITVQNYRSLGKVDLKLGRLTVLVGPNGSGKSNLVDVLRFVADSLRLGLDAAVANRHGIALLQRWSPGKASDIKVELEIEGYKQRNRYKATYGFGLKKEGDGQVGVRKEYCRVTLKQQTSEFHYENGSWVKPVSGGLAPQVDRGAFVLGAIAGVEPFSFVHHALVNVAFCSVMPNIVREPQKPGRVEKLNEYGANLASVLKNMKDKKSRWLPDFKAALNGVVPDIRDFQVQEVGGYLVIKVLHDSDKGECWFDASQESDGTLRVLGLLAALYQDPPPTLLAIEEPELTIHPGALAVLADVMKEAGGRAQLLLTTHSPDLISRLPVESLRAVEKLDGVTLISDIDETQRMVVEQKLFSAGDLLRLEGLQRQV